MGWTSQYRSTRWTSLNFGKSVKQTYFQRAVAEAQLAEWLVPTSEFLGLKSHKVYASVRKDKNEEEALTGRVFNKVYKDKTIQEQLISW